MHYPVLEIDLKKLRDNSKIEIDYLNKQGIEVMGVNKVFNGVFETAEAIVQGGVKVVAESIVANLIKIKDLPCEKALLRSPGLSEISDVIKYADISLASEIITIVALSKEAVKQNKTHKILLMIDMGDIREGIWFENQEEIETAIQRIIALPNLDIYGLGTNFGCYGTVLASEENARKFIDIAYKLEKKYSFKFNFLSKAACKSIPV